MPGKRAFEEQVAALDELRHAADENRIAPLRKALGHHNNFIVAQGCRPGSRIRLDRSNSRTAGRIRSLLRRSGEERSAMLGQERDQPHARRHGTSGCEQVFLRGMRHIQMEPVWGGQFRYGWDSARYLRAGAGAMPQPYRTRSACASGRIAGRQRQVCSSRGSSRHRTGRLAVGRAAAAPARGSWLR